MKTVKKIGALIGIICITIGSAFCVPKQVAADVPSYEIIVGERIENQYGSEVTHAETSNPDVVEVRVFTNFPETIRVTGLKEGDATISVYVKNNSTPAQYHIHVKRINNPLKFSYVGTIKDGKKTMEYVYEVKNNTKINFANVEVFAKYGNEYLRDDEYDTINVSDLAAKGKGIITISDNNYLKRIKKPKKVSFDIESMGRGVVNSNGKNDTSKITLNMKKDVMDGWVKFTVKNNYSTESKILIDPTVYYYVYDSGNKLVGAGHKWFYQIKPGKTKKEEDELYVDNIKGMKVKYWMYDVWEGM